jgi:hypothetical protein
MPRLFRPVSVGVLTADSNTIEAALKCKNIGTNKTYLSTDECVTKMQNDKRTGLNEHECPNGVSDKELASCLKSIREEDCGNPLDSISRLTNCRTGAMCMK